MSQPAAEFSPNLGPRNRESFFAAQRRNRRSTWLISWLCLAAALVMGLPLTLVLTPLIYTVTLATAEIINAFSPLPPEFWANAHAFERLLVTVGNAVLQQQPIDPSILAWGLTALLAPGIILSLLLWLTIVAMFRRAGVGGVLLSLRARPPDKNDLKELQLADAAEEMAIAAGLPAPRLMLMDSWAANAAAIGTCPADACIVIARRMLDEMDRDEIQGILAHLVASIGNGDLRIAFDILSVFETCGLLVTLINAPFGPEARGVVVKMVRFCLVRCSPEVRATEADELAELLARHVEMDQDDIDRLYDDSRGRASLPRRFLRLLFFPILWTNMAVKITLWFFTAELLGPSIALLWRTRRYLADAGAVQLTRSPDGLTKALEKLAAQGAAIPRGTWASHLFLIGGSGSASGPSRAQMQTMISAWKNTSENPISIGASPVQSGRGDDAARMRQELTATARAAMMGDTQAIARMVAFSRAMHPGAHIPTPINLAADINAARRGDRAALERLQQLKEQVFPSEAETQPGSPKQSRPKQSSTNQSSALSGSMLSFHPPLKRRLKRLQRMGAHVDQGELRSMSTAARIFATVLWLVIGPLLLLAASLMLVVIAMMVLLNLLFLALWLAAIHGIFTLLGHG